MSKRSKTQLKLNQADTIGTNNCHIKTTDFLVSGEEFFLKKNETFGFLETHPSPLKQNLSAYYESEAYISHTDSNKGMMSFLYQRIKKFSLVKKTALIYKLNNGATGSLLDIGAGTGDFLKTAQTKGWKTYGVEPNSKARERAATKGVVLKVSLEEFEDKQYDVVTLWHVLEHLPDLENQIKKIQFLVKEGGVLLIAVPNYNSFDARYYKNFWAAYDVPRHLWHFSKESMRKLIPSNFRLEKTLPMIFDSFYVSLVSEKYKNGNTFSFKAISIGLLSNLKAFFSKEYSSLIYVFKNKG